MSGTITHEVDIALPGMPIVTDPALMTGVLDRSLGATHGIRVREARLRNLRYRPLESCTALYETLSGNAADEPTLVSVHLRAVRGDLPMGVPLSEVEGVAYVYPSDPVLPHLAHTNDPARMAPELGGLLRRGGLAAEDLEITTLAYRPTSRAALGYHAVRPDPEAPCPNGMIGKLHGGRGPLAHYEKATRLWRAAEGKVNVARPVAYLERWKFWLQAFVPGVELGTLVATPALLAPLEQTAHALAALHGLDLDPGYSRPPEREGRVVDRWLSQLKLTGSSEYAQYASFVRQVVALIEEKGRVDAPVHGALHLANVLVSEGGVTFIDTDTLARGDRHVDLARVLSSLRACGLRRGDERGTGEARELFIQSYARLAPVDPDRLRLYEAASLIVLAASRTGSGIDRRRRDLLEAAKRTLGGVTSRSPSGARTNGIEAQVRALLEAYGLRPVGLARRSSDVGRSSWRAQIIVDGRPVAMSLTARPRSAAVEDHARASGLLAACPGAVRLPRLLLGNNLALIERPAGEALSSLLGSTGAAEAAERVGRALLHTRQVGGVSGVPASPAPPKMGRRLASLSALDPRLGARAERLADRALADLSQRSCPPRPGFAKVNPAHLLLLPNGGVTLGEVRALLPVHPRANAGELIARLLATASARGNMAVASAMTGALEAQVWQTDGRAAEDLQALTVLHLVCQAAKAGRRAAELIGCAELLSAAGPRMVV